MFLQCDRVEYIDNICFICFYNVTELNVVMTFVYMFLQGDRVAKVMLDFRMLKLKGSEDDIKNIGELTKLIVRAIKKWPNLLVSCHAT